MKIVIGHDHTGYDLKKFLINNLQDFDILDIGVGNVTTSNYAEIGIKLGEYILNKKADIAIGICGTGIGISISLNKVKNVYCALCNDVLSAKLAKEHNNANAIAIGARAIGKEYALEIVKVFIKTKFQKGRHLERTGVIKNYENE